MPLSVLSSQNFSFPPVHQAEPDGLLAIGGDLHPLRLLEAYKRGIFPWYEGDVPLWWCPHPRFVLFPEELKVSKSMKTLLKKNIFHFTRNQAFPEVILHCAKTPRNHQDGTWINSEIINAYTALHRIGAAVSAETWNNGKLVGGLYGILWGNVFFGESMFSLESNASKFAFIKMVEFLKTEGVRVIDCQVHTDHLERLGARFIPREQFCSLLEELTIPDSWKKLSTNIE